MMDEELRQTMVEVREMKKMCGNINMKLTNIVTQRGQDWKKKLEAEYQRGLEDGKAVHEKGCEGCKYQANRKLTCPCSECANNFKNQWTAKDDKIKRGDIVNVKGSCNDDSLGVVTNVCDDNCYIMWGDGSGGAWCKDSVVKTGKHIDVDKFLGEIVT